MTRHLAGRPTRVWLSLVLVLAAATACASGGAPARATSGAGGAGAGRSASYDRELLTRAELEARSGSNMLDVVSTLRSAWLITTTSSIGRESASGPAVYMDGRRIGEAGELRSIGAQAVESARYLSASRAQSKYGLSEARPVIELVGRGRKP